MGRVEATAAMGGLLLVSACQAGPAAQAATQVADLATHQVAGSHPTPVTKDRIFMDEKPKKDRRAPASIPAVEHDGIRYEQASDGRAVGAAQVGGVLVASDAATGARLWTLAVYCNPIDQDREADVQWVFFTSMVFADNGMLRISNEAGKSFLVDVKKRTVTPVP